MGPGPGVRWSGDGSLAPRRAPRWGVATPASEAPSTGSASDGPAEPVRPPLPPAAVSGRQPTVDGMVLASIPRRLAAFFIDLVVKMFLLIIVMAFSGLQVEDPLDVPVELVLGATALNFGYAFLFGISGVSPAQRLLRIRIVALDGSTPGVRRSFVRSVFSLNETLLYVSAGWILFSGRRQAVHDRVAGTLMVAATEEPAPPR
ncbi:MAG: RDD family protein [Dehalococcoidia bacterium]